MPTSPAGFSHVSSVDDGGNVAARPAEVAWFCADRGFGQLRTPDGEFVYVDQRDIRRDGFRALEPGQHVLWMPGHDAHGLVARHVVVDESKSAIAS